MTGKDIMTALIFFGHFKKIRPVIEKWMKNNSMWLLNQVKFCSHSSICLKKKQKNMRKTHRNGNVAPACSRYLTYKILFTKTERMWILYMFSATKRLFHKSILNAASKKLPKLFLRNKGAIHLKYLLIFCASYGATSLRGTAVVPALSIFSQVSTFTLRRHNQRSTCKWFEPR